MTKIDRRFSLVVLILLFVVSGCSGSYTPPGKGVDLGELTAEVSPAAANGGSPDRSINGTLAKQPLARFPTAVAVARVQACGYHSDTVETYGSGAFTVVTTRDIEDPAQIDKLSKLPGIICLSPLSRLLLPKDFQSDLQLREAAAKLHADILLIYTIDTKFAVDDHLLPMSVVTLGLSPNQVANVTCTASAILIDTRNGYVYGAAEKTAKDSQLASAWTSAAAVDAARRRAEKSAFSLLVDDLQQTWALVYANYSQPRAPMEPRTSSTHSIPWDQFHTIP